MNDEEWEDVGRLVAKPVSEIKGVWMTAENWEAIKAELARLRAQLDEAREIIEGLTSTGEDLIVSLGIDSSLHPRRHAAKMEALYILIDKARAFLAATKPEEEPGSLGKNDTVWIDLPGWPRAHGRVTFVRDKAVTVLVDGYAASNTFNLEYLTLDKKGEKGEGE